MREREINSIAVQFKKEAVVPFWMWNDELEKNELLRQLQEIKKKGINQVIIHPRFGLETPYLSEEWFRAISWVLKEAKKQKMGIWIYDEFNWPSGYAGGKVLNNHPEFQAMHITSTGRGFKKRKTAWKPAFSEGFYIDVLNPKAVDAFIETTYEQYWQRFKEYFGKTILGFFTDEPGLYNNFAGSDVNSLPWSEALPEFFRKEYGYELESMLDNIWRNNGITSIETRVNFWEAISLLYQESYFRKLQKWCHERGVAFVGHVLGEESLVDTVKTQGNFFTTMKYLDLAGYDLLGRLEPKTIIAANLARSSSKLFNLHGVCAETFGIFGWDLTPEEMRRVAKWQIDMGLDVLIPHALYYSLRGNRHDDCPPSLFADKYWSSFDEFVAFVRDSTKEKKEEQSQTAIYYPIESIWGQLSPEDSSKADIVDHAFRTVSFACYNVGIDFDYITSDAIIGNRLSQYRYLLLPQVEVLPLDVLKKVVLFANKGSTVVAVDSLPKFATKARDQNLFLETLRENSDLFQHLSLPGSSRRDSRTKSLNESFQNIVARYIPPIWLARAVRLAKLLGYKKPISVEEKTGMEEPLKLLFR